MANPNTPQRMLFTFRRNGDNNGNRLVEIMAELIEEYEAPAEGFKQSWFGMESDVVAMMESLEFPLRDVEGVMGSLHTNRDATREAAVLASDLVDAGFRPSA